MVAYAVKQTMEKSRRVQGILSLPNAPPKPPAVSPARQPLYREDVWSGGVIRVKVPKDAGLMRASEHVPYDYLQTARCVKGGYLQLFFADASGNLTAWRGKTVTAHAAVKRKIFAEGPPQYYVDLSIDDEAVPGYELCVYAYEREVPEDIDAAFEPIKVGSGAFVIKRPAA